MSVSLYGSGNTVIQVQSTTKTDTFTMSGGTLTSVTGLSVSITPQSTTSKILVIYSITMIGQNSNSNSVFQLLRGSTAIAQGNANGSAPRLTGEVPYIGDPNSCASVGGNFLDAPSTTSSLTYSIQVASGGAGSVYVNRSQNYGGSTNNYDGTYVSTITVMEIAYS
jgi:hypothetical protein